MSQVKISRAVARELADLLVHVIEGDGTPLAIGHRASGLRTFLLDVAGPSEPKTYAARAILFVDHPNDREEWARESASSTWRLLVPSSATWDGESLTWDGLIERGEGRVEIWEPSS